MAKGGQIDIEINLTGQEDIEGQIEGVKAGAGDVGEAFSTMSTMVDSSNEQMAEGFGGLGEGVGGLLSSVGDLKGGFSELGKGGAAGMLALIGPIGAVLGSLYALYQAFKQISGAALEAENRMEAVQAASGDMTGKLEALSEKGILPVNEALEHFIDVNMRAQISKELAQKVAEKTTKSFMELIEAEEALTTVTKKLDEINQGVNAGFRSRAFAVQQFKDAQERLNAASVKHTATVKKISDAYRDAMAPMSEAAKLNLELEETSKEALLTKAKEQIEIRKTIELLKIQTSKTNDLAQAEAKLNAETKAKISLLKINEMAKDGLKSFVSENDKYIKSVNQAALTEKNAAIERDKLREAERLKQKQDRATRAKEHRARLAQRRALEIARQKMDEAAALRILSDQAKLNELVIKNTQTGTDAEISLIEHRYSEAQRLAGDNHTQQLIAEEIYISELESLNDKLIDQETAKNKKLDDLRKKEALEVLNAQNKLQAQSDAIMRRAGDAAGAFGKAFAAAAADAIWTSKSIAESLRASMDALGRQATIEALMEGARALKDLALSNFAGAAMHGKAAAAFLGVAVAAKATGAAVGGGGGGGGSPAGVSPLGSPLTDTAPQRDTAQRDNPMIFNISMGTVYSTEQGALTALTNTITREINRDRRGSPRLRGT